MTAYARCEQCGWGFSSNDAHPVAPAHINPATGTWCAGASHEAAVEATS